MRYIIGIAPAQNSETIIDGKLAAWCLNTECGSRLRALIDEGPQTIFRNASDKRPPRRLKNGKPMDRQPWASHGRDLLCAVADDGREECPARILLLGLSYWRRALGLLVDAERVLVDRYAIPVGIPFPICDGAGHQVAEITLIAHPSLWPVVEHRTRAEYRSFTIDCLVRQNFRTGIGGNRHLTEKDYDDVFRSFGF
jgi:hypothetical protein